MATDIADIGKQAGVRFQLVNAVPAAALVVFVSMLVLVGAFDGKPTSQRLLTESTGLVSDNLCSQFAIFLVSLVGNSFQTRLVKNLEGYWNPTGPTSVLMVNGRNVTTREGIDLASK